MLELLKQARLRLLSAATCYHQRKSQKKGGKSSGIPIPKSDSAAPDAYDQETRDIILSMSNVDKKSLDGSYILKDVSLGMYMGAKIGILGKERCRKEHGDANLGR